MNVPLATPQLIGSTFVTANAGNQPPKADPVFDAASITLQRRMRFNPLRTLDPENLSVALDQFDIGILRQAALLWDSMARRDDTLSFVKPQLESAIAAKPWGVQKKKNADPTEAARHAAALEYFYGNLTAVDAFDRNERGGLHLLLRQMGSSFAYRYAVHHFVWDARPAKMIEVEGADPVPALTATLEFVPLWFFENTTGTLRFLPFGGFGITGEELNWDGEWMVTTGAGIMFAASICYVFKRLTFQDWTIFNERYAQAKPVGQTNAQKDSEAGRAMEDIIANFNSDQGIVLFESQPGDKPPISLIGPNGTVSVDLFERFLDRQDRKITVMFRGSDLRNMSRGKDVTGVSAQTDETEALEIAHCARISDACQTFIDRQVIRYCFGEGVEPAAYFGLSDMEQEDTTELRESAGFLADRGALVELDTVAERLGITLTEDPEQALKPANQATQPDPNNDGIENDNEPETTPNAALAELEHVIEAALRTGNYPGQARDTHGRFSSSADQGGGSGGSAREMEFETRANIQKGRRAMGRVTSEHVDVNAAMHREGVGDIDFRWQYRGLGIEHIITRREHQDKVRPGLNRLSVDELLDLIPEVIARGKINSVADKLEIDHQGIRVILARAEKAKNAWVVSGFEVDPESQKRKESR